MGIPQVSKRESCLQARLLAELSIPLQGFWKEEDILKRHTLSLVIEMVQIGKVKKLQPYVNHMEFLSIIMRKRLEAWTMMAE